QRGIGAVIRRKGMEPVCGAQAAGTDVAVPARRKRDDQDCGERKAKAHDARRPCYLRVLGSSGLRSLACFAAVSASVPASGTRPTRSSGPSLPHIFEYCVTK